MTQMNLKLNNPLKLGEMPVTFTKEKIIDISRGDTSLTNLAERVSVSLLQGKTFASILFPDYISIEQLKTIEETLNDPFDILLNSDTEYAYGLFGCKTLFTNTYEKSILLEVPNHITKDAKEIVETILDTVKNITDDYKDNTIIAYEPINNEENIKFIINEEPIPMLELRGNGDILVKGKITKNDMEVVDGFKDFLAKAKEREINQIKATDPIIPSPEKKETVYLKDFYNNVLSVGDYITYPVRKGAWMDMHTAKVKGIANGQLKIATVNHKGDVINTVINLIDRVIIIPKAYIQYHPYYKSLLEA